LETESKYSTECGASDIKEGTGKGRGKRRSVIPDVEAVWRSFEEESLMDLSGSDFKGGVDSGGESSLDVSLVEESVGGMRGKVCRRREVATGVRVTRGRRVFLVRRGGCEGRQKVMV